MNIDKMLLTSPAATPNMLGNAEAAGNGPEDKKMRFAKDFEAVLLNRLCGEMKNTIGNWGLEKSSGSDQINGIFYMMLSQSLADQGGLGLWKDIYRSISDTNPTAGAASVDQAGDNYGG